MTVQHGKIHEYLGMSLDFTKQGKVVIQRTDYIENMLDSLDSENKASGIISKSRFRASR